MYAAIAEDFLPDQRQPGGIVDPVFGLVRHGSVHGLWAVTGTALGLAQLTGGSRVITAQGDGSLSISRGWLRRRGHDRHVDLCGHRYTLHHTSPRRAQLRRDGVAICWLRCAGVARFRDARDAGTRTYAVIRWSETSDRAAAAVAHLLASRYGVGAFGAVLNLLHIPVRAVRGLRDFTAWINGSPRSPRESRRHRR